MGDSGRRTVTEPEPVAFFMSTLSIVVDPSIFTVPPGTTVTTPVLCANLHVSERSYELPSYPTCRSEVMTVFFRTPLSVTSTMGSMGFLLVGMSCHHRVTHLTLLSSLRESGLIC